MENVGCAHTSHLTRDLAFVRPFSHLPLPKPPLPPASVGETEAQRRGVTVQGHPVRGKHWAQTGSSGIQPWSQECQRPRLASTAPLQPQGGSSAPATAGLAVGRSHSALPGPGGREPAGWQGQEQREKYTVSFNPHSFPKIIIGCVYTLLKNRKSGNTPSFWAGQLPSLCTPVPAPTRLFT